MSHRWTAVAVGVLCAVGVMGSATADPAPQTPPPDLKCHTPWQFPQYADGQWRCSGGPGPVVVPKSDG